MSNYLDSVAAETNNINLKEMSRIHNSLNNLFNDMSNRLIEREQLVRLIGLTFFCKANCFLIGERGVAKSYAIESLGDSISGTKKLWQLLLKKDTKPEEVFGRTYQSEEGEWKINTKGSLLDAHNVFADEMFKARGEILSGLLEVLVDRGYTFGDGEKRTTDILAFFGASNEYPTERFMLPYVDRFDIWIEIKPIQNRENRKKFYLDDYIRTPLLDKYISRDDIEFVYNETSKVYFDERILSTYIDITTNFISAQVKTSDRKYRRIIRLIKTIAYMNNRDYVDYSDMFILLYSAWQNEIEKDRVERILYETIFGKKEEIKAYTQEVRNDFSDKMNEFNSQLYKFFSHKYVFSGDNQDGDFMYVLDIFKHMIASFNLLLGDIEKLENKNLFNKAVQTQLDNNIIIVGVKERVFTNDVVNLILELKSDITEKKEGIENWIIENKDLYHYKNNQKNNF